MTIFSLLWLMPTLPAAGFVALAILGARMPRWAVALIGAGSVGLSSALAIALGIRFLVSPPPGFAHVQTLWTWIGVGAFRPEITLYFDALSLVMTLVVTFVSFLIHVYSIEYMRDDDGYSRFFAYMNLFVASMLILVLAGDLLPLYMGWEGVGLCSYLLIGFWYRDHANGRAAMKAFIVTRVGDTAMAIGLFLIFVKLGTLNIQDAMAHAMSQWPVGSGLAVAAAALLLGGALGKSAQLPLQVWLPDAMAGPTPVSALIHAATMVTAGVYLIARTHVLFELAPAVQTAVAVIGAATLLMAGCSALVQSDIKRVLAYSTISQIGYMFLALGVGAWSAAIFHFMTHAFFKALLFMGAGVIILSLHHEQNMFKMGGLRKRLPLTFWTFLVGAMSLSAIPLITAGFYSKDAILWEAWMSGPGGRWFAAAGTLGAFLTSIYTFRMMFMTFYGEAQTPVHPRTSRFMGIPLLLLAFCAVAAGFVDLPRTLGNFPLFSSFLEHALPAASAAEAHPDTFGQLVFQIVTELIVLAGVGVAYALFLARRDYVQGWAATPLGAALHRLWFSDWGFDWIYGTFLVRPFVSLAQWNKGDFIDSFYSGVAETSRAGHEALSLTQTGRVRWYAMGVAIGAVIAVAVVVFL